VNTLQFLSSILGKYKRSGNRGNYVFTCPKCKREKFYYDIKDNRYNCYTCDLRGNSLYSFVKKICPERLSEVTTYKKSLTNYGDDEYGFEEDEQTNIVELPPDNIKVVDVINGSRNIPGAEAVINYLKQRGITERLISKYDIRFYKVNGDTRVIVPSYNSKNELNYYVTRTIMDGYMKYKNPPINKSDLIPFENTINWDYAVILTEGVFDSIKISHNSIPLLGCTINETWILFKKLLHLKNRIYLCLDNDKAGIEGTLKIAELFLNHGKTVFYIDISPYKDVGGMKKREFLQRKNESEIIDEMWLLSKKAEVV